MPAKFRGLDPRHLRLPEDCRDEAAFHRRKYIHNQKTFQYFRNAIRAENGLLRTKERENSLVIKNLMSNFSEQILSSKEDGISSLHRCIHRLFLRYANNDSEDLSKMFKFISRDRLLAFFEDFGIPYAHNPPLLALVQQREISEFYFLEILHLLSVRPEDRFYSDIRSFLEAHVLTRPALYLPREWNLYEQHRAFIAKHAKVRRFREKLEFLHEQLLRGQRGSSYSFDQMVEVMWMLKIYPFMISKKKLRFFYLYTQSEEVGISISDIADIYIYIALSKEGSVEDNVREIVAIVADFSKGKSG